MHFSIALISFTFAAFFVFFFVVVLVTPMLRLKTLGCLLTDV